MLDPNLWRWVLTRLEANHPVHLTHVAWHSRHSPGTTGATLAVDPRGDTAGTIGGGVMEGELIARAAATLEAWVKSGAARVEVRELEHRRKASRGERSGLFCAGRQTNLSYVLGPAKIGEVRRILALLDADAPGTVVVGPGGLTLDEERPAALPPLSFEQQGAGFELRAQLLNVKRVAILGGGHCGLALSRVMAQLGYTVTIFDTRADVFTLQQNDFATHKIVVEDYAEAGALIRQPEWTHVVVMSANVDDDIRGLLGVVRGPFPYVGVMGAPAKLTRIRGALREADVAQEAIDRLYAPIGLPMTSNTPEEIAISVAAEILRERERLFPFAAPAPA
ncbi:XdhC family protein [Lujinxingia litoralis]|uniref:XdhC family protein n=1 Tax=Lujinxingia litoralis TaxID=2211119 RepID=UPI001314E806|nr:XdhC family protein [Lujinxingia litoralis]